ncbi:glycosyltransferase family 9 protein [Desulfocurvibacter africanus]|uniref:Glycosyl transferase family 9 n=1 Tax=Desulfocurvibacter africanus subsp. africanus str. Walvis Bay TaxID=690850 RepID=F3YWR2_DESAF|nr:glycosyltransferase family 9 protein [Desulfocurvibacter africanus]EGJ50555.1 glycosyl transferase family 9 [Desulfocurvibacter africanus subsp. africanus str. Walvis Bay]
MNTLVINLTRFGDLLQTQPVLSGLAAQGRTGLVCLDNFQATTEVLAGLDTVYPLQGAALLASLDRGWLEGLTVLKRYLAKVTSEYPDCRVVNLTPTITARLLASCLGQHRVGFGLDGHGFTTHSNPWAMFLQTASSSRGCSPFNVVDVFRRVAELPPANGCFSLMRPSEEEVSATRTALAGDAPHGSNGFVALQLGASEERRRWPLEHFARLGRLLWEKLSLTPVLLGSPGERPLAERFSALADYPHVDRIGRTNLSSLAATLTCCRLLVTNDTGTMHLAAGLDMPVAAIFLATAQPWDTGPYRQGSLSLEPALACHPCGFGITCEHGLACRQAIKPDVVFGLVRSRLEQGAWSRAQTPGTRAWLAEVEPSGFMGLRSLTDAPDDARTAWVRLQRRFLSRFLDGQEVDPSTVGSEAVMEDSILTGELKAACDLLTLLASQGALLAREPRPALKAKFLGYWQRLQALLAQSGRLKVLGSMLLFEMEARSSDMQGLLTCLRRYLELLQGLRSLVR